MLNKVFVLRSLFFMLVSFCIGLSYTSCNSKPDSPPVFVRLDSLAADSMPFPNCMRTVVSVNDPSIDLNALQVESPELYKILPVSADIERKTSEERRRLPGILFVQGLQKSKPVFIFDSDNDKKFSNEIIYTNDEIYKIIGVHNVDLPIGNAHHQLTYYIKAFHPSMTFESSGKPREKRSVAFFVSMPIFRYGTFTAKDSSMYKFAVFNFFGEQYTNKTSMLVIVPDSGAFPAADTYPVTYKAGDTLFLHKHMYVFNSINKTGDSIELFHLKEINQNLGVDAGNYAFNVKFNDVLTGQTLSLVNDKSNYTLIDFWGTWCPPCLALTPKLQRLKQSYKERDLAFTGVAYDDSKADVKTYLEDHSIEWANAFDYRKGSTICSQYKVSAFPTLILLDQTGKIVVRATGTDALQRVEEYLKQAIRGD